MSGNDGLTASSLTSGLSFNWVFLVELIVCGVVTLFFLFYFNRLFATLVSYGIRAWTWHRYRVYIDIQALQISLLGGRIFFKGVRYHGNNETILIQNAYVTWSYWLRKVRELGVGQSQLSGDKRSSAESNRNSIPGEPNENLGAAEAGGVAKPVELPCRLDVVIQGAEWFIYNRSAAYDYIMASLVEEDGALQDVLVGEPEVADEMKGPKIRNKAKYQEKLNDISASNSLESGKLSETRSLTEKDAKSTEPIGHNAHGPPPPQAPAREQSSENFTAIENNFFLQFLPIHVECTRAAVVMGNENTRSVLITKVDQLSGEIDATYCRRPDQFRQLFNFHLKHPVIQIKPNDDYKEDQADAAARIVEGSQDLLAPSKQIVHQHSFLHRYRRKAMHKLQNLVPYFRTSVESVSTLNGGVVTQDIPGPGVNLNQWQGLSRYLDDNEGDRAKWSTIEYATVTTIFDSPEANMSYYWDVPGIVSAQPARFRVKSGMKELDINGNNPPEFGLDLTVREAMINYGPWADRQRADLQKVFFPSLCKDARPAKMLRPGQTRMSTRFKLYMQLDNETTLRVPMREESKNWKWKRQADTMGQRSDEQKQHRGKHSRKRKGDKGTPGAEARPFGWLDIKIGSTATLTYAMDMVAGSSGFSNTLELDLPNAEITTSVNHGLLWRSVDQRIFCDLSNPLQWNGLRTWSFDITSNGLELFLLREHIFLLIDLVDDWSSGPPSDFLTFSLFKYLLNLQFGNFRLYLNSNDSNIINNPSDFDDNTFVIIFGTALKVNLCLPLDKFQPHLNEIPFDIKAHTGGLNLHVPPWNTQATFLTSTELANLKDLEIKGAYQYCATTSTSNTDTLLLDVSGRTLEVQLYGFLIRYLLRLKDNYFGDDIRFKTLEEYQQILQVKLGEKVADPSINPPQKKSNDLDVVLGINIDLVGALLPANLYSCKSHTRLDTPNLKVDLRFTNYYMDLALVLSPIAFSIGNEDDPSATPVSNASVSELFIDGLAVYGHRVFGLPPTEPTYVCNWDFTVGAITGECSIDFLVRLIAGGKAFAFSFDDDENALPSISTPVLHDVTFLRASVEPVRIWLHVDEAAFLVSTGVIGLNFNDWAGLHYSKRLVLEIPDIKMACVNGESASRHRSRSYDPVETHAYIHTAITLVMVDRKLGFVEDRLLQQQHLQREDLRTHRTDFLLRSNLARELPIDTPEVDPPAMCFPPLPLPLTPSLHDEVQSSTSTASSVVSRRKFLRRKTSLKSTISSGKQSQKSVIRAQRKYSDSEQRAELDADSGSRSRLVGPRRGQGTQTRDLSASTGRQSSFYSAIGDHGDRRGIIHSNVGFSSSYVAPYFPLHAVEPDPKDLPALLVTEDDEIDYEFAAADFFNLSERSYDEKETHTSFIIEFKQGIRAYLSHEAVCATVRLLTAMKPTDPVDLIDSLHVDSISEVFGVNKQKLVAGKSTDLNLRLPGMKIRFANALPSKSLGTSYDEVDQYDVSLLGLTLTARSAFVAVSAGPNAEIKDTSLLHLKLRSASISAKERFGDIADPQAAIDVSFDDILFWMSSTDMISASLNLKAVETSTRSSKVEYLASLLHRTTLLVSEFNDTFKSLGIHQRDRMQLFVWLVVTSGQHTTDPLFLTRPSYVLRSAADHLRVTDSWKVITRLRHMYNSLDHIVQQDIITRVLSNAEDCPNSASQRVLAELDRWRSWDLTDVSDCVTIQKIYKSLNKDDPANTSPNKPMRIALELERMSFLVDPGPKQSEIAFMTLIVKSNINNSWSDDEYPSGSNWISSQSAIVQIFCEDASINLNWELCELIENILKLYTKIQADLPATKSKSNPSPSPAKPYPIHVAIATEKGSVTLDAINIRSVSVSRGLKLSFVVAGEEIGGSNSASLMVSAEAATTKMRSHFQELMIFQLRQPSVYVVNEKHELDISSETVWKAAANCQELSFIVKQDPLVLSEVLDLLVGDEVAHIHRLITKIPKNTKIVEAVTPNPPESGLVDKVNVALFLHMYQISLPLLHSLTYNVSGVVARASVAAIGKSDLVFDFDIKENAHDVQTKVDDRSRSISLLHVPPTNGRITAHVGPEESTVSIFASLELVEFDVASIHSLLAALNRPEISNVVSEVHANLKNTKNRVDEIFGLRDQHDAPKSVSEVSKQLIYDAHFTFAGLNAFAVTPIGQGQHNSARISFEIGYVQLEAANRVEQSGPGLEFPEVHLNLKHIMCELSRTSGAVTEPCGNFMFATNLIATSKRSAQGDEVRSYHMTSDGLEINIFAETASTAVDVLGHLQDRIKDLDLSREKSYLQKLRRPNPRISITDEGYGKVDSSPPTNLFDSIYSLELLNIQISWIVATSISNYSAEEKENLVLSCKRIDLSTKRENSAKLTIEDLQLQMVPLSQSKSARSQNSALLPEVIFNVAYVSTVDVRRLAFQAAGKSLDLRLTSQFMIPATDIRKSIETASNKVRMATASWLVIPTPEVSDVPKRKPFLGQKRMESLLVDADFAGAMVHLQGKKVTDIAKQGEGLTMGRAPQSGRYGQFSQEDPSSMTILRAPGLAWKVEFKDNGVDDPSLNAEVKISASSNILYPTVVPLILEISSSVKDIVSDDDQSVKPLVKPTSQRFMGVNEDNILTTDPSAMLGRTRLNLGVRICAQEFSLSCQPIARVAATARFDDIYVTINTVQSVEHGHFFALSAAFTRLQASVQHDYSRQSTGSFDVDSVVLSLMNSKHVSGTSGISAILKISPMKVLVNAKQLQDYLLFREIWMPPEMRQTSAAPVASPTMSQSQSFSIQRYQQVAATGAFPWNAAISIAKLDVQLDLGQAIGKPAFVITNCWISSRKKSDWEQNLCLGFDKVGVESTGRTSGFVTLEDFKVRTSITWPERKRAIIQTPLVQASLGFSKFRVKASFDYQAFLVADITSFNFMMYNVRHENNVEGDRLVAILDGDSVQMFCTTTTASQGLALYQAFVKLAQEKRANYETSLKEIERFMRRTSVSHPINLPSTKSISLLDEKEVRSPISLHTDVVVTLKAVNMGIFPSTFFDHQLFKMEALNAQARFNVSMEGGKIHSGLGLTLGQLRIGLAGVKRPYQQQPSGDLSVEEVVASAMDSRGGTILRVPKVEATMETWQAPGSNHIDYIFKTSFEGRVEIGWNYSRISFIRGMYNNHSRALAQRLGKPLPISAVKITGVPDEEGRGPKEGEQQKIIAEVMVPQSKYDYTALEPPIIETPQLKDMGEATPPLEWIGLHRDRLPNLTHQIVIVSLLELASEVEDAYSKILGSS